MFLRKRSAERPNPSVNSRGCETLNALFGVAYDRTTLNPDLQLGNFGQPNERRKAVGIEVTPQFLGLTVRWHCSRFQL